MTKTQIPTPFTRDVDREIDKLTAENERLLGLLKRMYAADGKEGMWIHAEFFIEINDILKEQRRREALERPASVAKQHVEIWPKREQEAMRREVGIKEPDDG